MRRLALAFGVSLFAVGTAPALPVSVTTPQTRLEAGDIAPDFTLPGSDGKTYRLSDYRGKRAVVVAWFARAFSDG